MAVETAELLPHSNIRNWTTYKIRNRATSKYKARNIPNNKSSTQSTADSIAAGVEPVEPVEVEVVEVEVEVVVAVPMAQMEQQKK